MSPRAAATRSDQTAYVFLDAAAHLIDQAFLDAEVRGSHPTNTLKYPAALDWLRVTDVLRVAQAAGQGAASRKAFDNRWPDKDSFVRDAVVYTLCYRDDPMRDPRNHAELLTHVVTSRATATAEVRQYSAAFFSSLLADPRTYLLVHLTPLIGHHPSVHQGVLQRYEEAREMWRTAITELLTRLDIHLRSGWTVDMFDVVLQALLDGLLLRHRLQADQLRSLGWTAADLYANTAVALMASLLTTSPDDLSPEEVLKAVFAQSDFE